MALGKGHLEIVTLLLDKGADINAKDKVGPTRLVAGSGGRVARLLYTPSLPFPATPL